MISRTATSSVRSHRRGFTLMELMIVMGIIVLLLGMGVLAFNVITGNRSISTAQNQVAAMLGRARAIAINSTELGEVAYGVCFFIDPDTDRTAMAIIRRARTTTTTSSSGEEMDNYKGWVSGVWYQGGDRVIAVVRDPDDGNVPAARLFRCKVDHISANTVRPPRFPGEDTSFTASFPMENAYWIEVEPGNTGIIPGGGGGGDGTVELLPAGVGVQTITDPTVMNNGKVYDRYLRTGVILFDRMGRLEHLSYLIYGTDQLGQRIGLAPAGRIGYESAAYTLYSQLGVALYETEPFRSQSGSTEADQNPWVQIPGRNPGTLGEEQLEEQWLDTNATLLLVNRYSGELVRAR